MARPKKSIDITPNSASISSKPHKRQLSTTESPHTSSTPPSRVSKRIKELEEHDSTTPTKSTPKKSKYFQNSSDEDEVLSSENEDEEASGYEAESVGSTSGEESSAAESVTDSDFERNHKSRKKITPKRKASSTKNLPKTTLQDESEAKAGETELWRPGVKAGLGPGKAVFIAKPKPRGDGGIKYVPDRIHPNTMDFLADLKMNNDREWLKMHDPDYRQSWKDWESYVETLTEKISEIDETVPELPPKDLVFRIYRDVRFSKDPTPYKTHFSAAWSRTGRKGPYACYYVQIAPGNQSFVGGGLWMPEASALALVRADLDRRPKRMRTVLVADGIRKSFLGLHTKDEKKIIKAFADHNRESALKTKPKGYEADHPNIELLRLRSFTVGQRLKDEDILAPQGLGRILELVRAMTPFVTYLNNVVMPDHDEPSDENDEDDEG